MSNPILHRKGEKFEDDGHSLTFRGGKKASKEKPIQLDPEVKSRLQLLRNTNPVAFRDLAVRVLVEVAREMIRRNEENPVEFFELQRTASLLIGVSIETIKRYVFTHTAEGAELRFSGKGLLGVNPEFEEDDEEGSA